MASIVDFKNALAGGGARNNRFEIVVDFPAFAADSDTIRKTPFLATSSQLPGMNLGTIEQNFRGRQLKIPGDRTFDDFPASFLNDTDFAIRDAFERWQNAINSVNTNVGLNSPDDYYSTVSVYQLDAEDNRIKEYVLGLAYPSVVGPIELAQDSNDQIEVFEVTFNFSDMKTNTTN